MNHSLPFLNHKRNIQAIGRIMSKIQGVYTALKSAVKSVNFVRSCFASLHRMLSATSE